MASKRPFQDRYETGDLPWDLQRPDHNLVSFLERTGITPQNALVIGSGTGENSLLLAARGFRVTGIDISPRAVEIAQQKAKERDLPHNFFAHDILSGPVPHGPFTFAFDRGCFHVFSEPTVAALAARHIALSMAPGGIWLSLIASAEEPYPGHGPPRHRASSILAATEPSFRLLSLEAARMDSDRPDKMKIFKGLFQRRPEL